MVARRSSADADRNAAYYQTPAGRGPCVHCARLEADHIFGDCDDLRNVYTPAADPEAATRLDASRATLELQQKSRRQVDAGAESIEDSPLFGGPRQGRLF